MRCSRITGTALVSVLVDLVLVTAAGAGVPLGGEFQVNSYTPGVQSYSSIAMDTDGKFVVVWSSLGLLDVGLDGDGYGIFLRRVDAGGTLLGAELQVNSYTTGDQDYPAVAMQPNGNFIVVWHSYQEGPAASDGYGGYGVFGQRFNSSGTRLGGEFQVNSYTTYYQKNPALAVDGDGDFVVTWQSDTRDGSSYGVFAQRFSSAGVRQGAEFQVNTFTPYSQYFSAVAMSSAGDFIVVWDSNGQDELDPFPSRGVFGQRFDSAGTRLGAEFQVNTTTQSTQRAPRIGADDLGNFVVAWDSFGQDGSGRGIFAQRFDAAGSRQGIEFQVNTYTPNPQSTARIAMDGDGDFVIAWGSSTQDGSFYGAFLRRFNAAGVPQTSEIQTNVYTPGFQTNVVVATDDGGDFVAVWDSTGQDGDQEGVFGRRFEAVGAPTATITPTPSLTPTATPTASLTPTPTATSDGATLDIDGNGAVQALTDGLLVLRSLFGFTGATLITGAVGPGCTRCSAGDIQTYLASIASQLDVDGNGSLDALTDGLLVLRFLFGFTGSTLTTGAVGPMCTRCTAGDIQTYLAGLAS